MTIQKTPWFPHPRDAGARPTTTWPVGQVADYLLELDAELAPLLIRKFSDRYEAFLAGARFTARLLKYLESNPAAATHVGGALVGASAALGSLPWTGSDEGICTVPAIPVRVRVR